VEVEVTFNRSGLSLELENRIVNITVLGKRGTKKVAHFLPSETKIWATFFVPHLLGSAGIYCFVQKCLIEYNDFEVLSQASFR